MFISIERLREADGKISFIHKKKKNLVKRGKILGKQTGQYHPIQNKQTPMLKVVSR